MSMSLFEKFRLATLGNLHDVLDRVIDMNSTEAVKQQIRDLEGAMDQINTTTDKQKAVLTQFSRELSESEDKQGKLNRAIDTLLAQPGKDAQAAAFEKQLMDLETQMVS